MSYTQQALLGVVIVVFAVLYMAELPPDAEDEMIELGSTEVILVTRCQAVFKYMSDLSNYPQWFPGITEMVELQPGPVQNGKKFEEVSTYPIIGDVARPVYISSYVPSKQIQFKYLGWNKLSITITATQTTDTRCLVNYRAATRNTSFLYHIFVGMPYRIVYSLRGRHAMFSIRSMFNNVGNDIPRKPLKPSAEDIEIM